MEKNWEDIYWLVSGIFMGVVILVGIASEIIYSYRQSKEVKRILRKRKLSMKDCVDLYLMD